MHPARRATVVGLLVLTALGCDQIKSLFKKHTSSDPIVGKWREVGNDAGSTITFEGDGTFQVSLGRIDPGLGEDFVALMKAMEKVKGRYSRSADALVLSYDRASFKEATAHLKKVGPDTSKGNAFDTVYTYKLSGDVLETTTKDKGKTSRYVRVRL